MAASDKKSTLTHLDDHGRAKMVSVGQKNETVRIAAAKAAVRMSSAALEAVRSASGRKGDAVQVARVAGIMAAKKTSELIPLCHPVRLTSVQVTAEFSEDPPTVELVAIAEALDRTGVEMEAMTAASVAALALYDMIKGIDRCASIEAVQLLQKSGGKSGDFTRSVDR